MGHSLGETQFWQHRLAYFTQRSWTCWWLYESSTKLTVSIALNIPLFEHRPRHKELFLSVVIPEGIAEVRMGALRAPPLVVSLIIAHISPLEPPAIIPVPFFATIPRRGATTRHTDCWGGVGNDCAGSYDWGADRLHSFWVFVSSFSFDYILSFGPA